MKKSIISILSIFILSLASTVFAQEAETVEAAAVETETAVEAPAVESPAEEITPYEATEMAIKKKGLFFNKDTVFASAENLSLEERTQLYESYKKNPTLVGVLNGVVGFGLGSFIQKEFLPAAGFLTTELVGWSFVGWGIFVIHDIAQNASESGNAGEAIAAAFFGPLAGFMVICLGGIIVIASRAASAGICVGISNGYNAKLKEALGLKEDQEVALLPIVDPLEQKAGLVISLKL